MKIFIDILVNTMDVFIVYCLTCSLTFTKIKLSLKNITIGIFLGSTTGLFLMYTDVSKYKFVIQIVMFITILTISKEKLYDVVILQVLVVFIMGTIQIPVIFFTKPVIFHKNLEGLIPQIFTVIISYKLSAFSLYKIKMAIEKNILIKLFIFLSIIIYIGASYKNYNEMNLNYVFYFFIATISLFGVYAISKYIYLYTKKYPAIHHDLHNMMDSLRISANHANSVEEIRLSIDEICEMLNFKTTNKMINNEGHPKDIITSFIKEKELLAKKNPIHMDIQYYEDNQEVSLANIILMLGILIDNAIDASPCEKVIHVFLRTAEYNVNIAITNEIYVNDYKKFIAHFETGKSSKMNDRGYGINNLRKLVKKYKGKVSAEVSYPSITIIIEIRN